MVSREDFIEFMTAVFDGLQEYYPKLRDSRFRDHIAHIIWMEGVQDIDSGQKTYEKLRDRVEGFLTKFEEGPREWFPGLPKEE